MRAVPPSEKADCRKAREVYVRAFLILQTETRQHKGGELISPPLAFSGMDVHAVLFVLVERWIVLHGAACAQQEGGGVPGLITDTPPMPKAVLIPRPL